MSAEIKWTTERRKLGDLQPWDRNPRSITNASAERLVDSVESFGQVETLAIGPDDELYNGHQRLNVLCGEYGADYEVDVRVASRPLTEKEREKLTVYLHKGAAGDWDFEALTTDFDADDLLAWGFEPEDLGIDLDEEPPEPSDAEPQVDRADELRKEWGVELGQMWRLPARDGSGEHRIICGDCTEADVVARVMDGDRPLLTLTSPPYPEAEMWEIDANTLIELGNRVISDAYKISDPGSVLCWNTSDMPRSNAGMIPNGARDTLYALEVGWKKRGDIIWYKSSTMLPLPPFSRRPTVPNCTHENILVFFRGDWKPIDDKGVLSTELLTANRESVWTIAPASATELHHKAPFPLELALRCVGLWSVETAIVYEPFSGSGTTIIACENLNRYCRAIEISPSYVAVALQRYTDSFDIEPELITEDQPVVLMPA